MPDVQLIRFNKFLKTPDGRTVGSTQAQFIPTQIIRKSSRVGIPYLRGDLNMPLNDDGTFAPGKFQTDPNTGQEIYNESPIRVFDIDKAMQDVTRGLLTVKGTNYLSPNFGTSLATLVNKRKISDVAPQIVGEVENVLGYLAQFNEGYANTELVAGIVSLDAVEDNYTINLELVVRTAEGSQGSLLLT